MGVAQEKQALTLTLTLTRARRLVAQEKKACEAADGSNCTAADYTFRLHKIPKHKDLEQLENQLRDHFESVLSKEKVT